MHKICQTIVVALCIYFAIYPNKPVSLFNYLAKPILDFQFTAPTDTINNNDTIIVDDNGNDTIYEIDTIIEYEYVYDTVYVVDTIVEEIVETFDSTNYLLGLLNLPRKDSTPKKQITYKLPKIKHKTSTLTHRDTYLPLIFPGNKKSGSLNKNLYYSIGSGYLPGISSQDNNLYSIIVRANYITLPSYSYRTDTVDVYYQYNNNKLDTFYIVKQSRKTAYQLHADSFNDTITNGFYRYNLSFLEYPLFINSMFPFKNFSLRMDFGCIARIFINRNPLIYNNLNPADKPKLLHVEYSLVCMPGIQTNRCNNFHFRLSPFFRFQINTNNITTNQPDEWLHKNNYGIHFALTYTID